MDSYHGVFVSCVDQNYCVSDHVAVATFKIATFFSVCVEVWAGIRLTVSISGFSVPLF